MPCVENQAELKNMALRDWRKALLSPPGYRVGNRTVRIQTHFVWMITLLGLLLLIVFYVGPKHNQTYVTHPQISWTPFPSALYYNQTYPLSSPIKGGGMITYRLGLIADMDTNSKCTDRKNIWKSYLKRGYLSYVPGQDSVIVSWDNMEPTELTSSYALKDRGMELSELVVFNGRLLTFDDRTGLVYEIVGDRIIPWLLLVDGNGLTTKGFKSEWATVRNSILYVGSIGKEWTTDAGVFESNDPQWVKTINVLGEVHHENWVTQYKAIRSAFGIEWPGYMIHESGSWSDVHGRWFFLPRRCSKERYNDTRDEHMSCNILITADSQFQDIKVTKIGTLIPTHGFSSFKFVPGSNDEVIVALKTEELNGRTATYIMAFHTSGKILLAESKIADLKYEGLEFI